MAQPATAQELVSFIINVPVFKSFLRHSRDLRAKRTALLLQNREKSPSNKKLLLNFEEQIHLLNKVFLEMCSSLTTSVEGLSINRYPITLDENTAISLTSVNSSNLEAASSQDAPIRISISASTPHEIANTIINDLVFKCIFRNMTALLPKEKSHKSLHGKFDGHISLLADVIFQICSMLTSFVEGFSYTPRHRMGICTRGAFVEGCYVKGIVKESLRELVSFIINVPVFKSFLRHSRDLRAKRTALLVNREKMKSPSSKKLLVNIEDLIQLLNKVFLEICSSLTTSVEGLSFNCHPITLDANTAISLGSVNPSNVEAPPHEIANTIINDLVFKCIFRNMAALLPKETSCKSLHGKVDGRMSLLVGVIHQICSMLTSYVEGFSYTPRHCVGICTRGAFVEGCYVKGIMKKPEVKAKPSYLYVAKGLHPKGEVLTPSSPFTQGHTYSPYPGYYEGY